MRKVVGIIAEYNPFHNGHLYHLSHIKEQCGADFTICAMSGNFTQRGEPAVFNKWVRAQMALTQGADVVVELPVVYATRSAKSFAAGAVRLLAATGIVDYLGFGSEAGNLDVLLPLARLLRDEPPLYKATLAEQLAKGLSYPHAVASSITVYTACHPIPELEKVPREELCAAVASPNNLLALEYLQALPAGLTPVTIPRGDAGYHSRAIAGNLASATAIRHELAENGPSPLVAQAVPSAVLDLITTEINGGRGPVFPEMLAQLVIGCLRRSETQALAAINDVSEGLEHRLKRAATRATTLSSLVAAVKSRRYTWTRIQRILLYILLGLTQTKARAFDQCGPQYIRVLGFTHRGRQLLKLMNKKSALPVIIRPVAHMTRNKAVRGGGEENPPVNYLEEMLHYDILATDLYSLLYPAASMRRGGLDFLTSPVRL